MFLSMAILLTLGVSKSPVHQPVKIKKVKVKFVYSPYADFLYYLFYHNERWFPLDSIVPIDSLITIKSLITLPELAAISDIKRYNDLFKLLDFYKDTSANLHPMLVNHDTMPIPYDTIRYLLKEGERYFPAFLSYWKANIKPLEEKLISEWKNQLGTCELFKRFQELERLPFPYDSINVGCIALHLSGSAIPYPPGLFSMIFDKEATAPDLAWIVGHEGTHLVVGKYGGVDWENHPLARKAIKLVVKNGGSKHDIEETLCLFMQLKFSQECGFTDKDLKMSEYLDNPVMKKICRGLEDNWKDYKTHPEKYPTIIDFVLKTVISIFSE